MCTHACVCVRDNMFVSVCVCEDVCVCTREGARAPVPVGKPVGKRITQATCRMRGFEGKGYAVVPCSSA